MDVAHSNDRPRLRPEYARPVREQTEQPRARPGRCANHPEVAEAGRCFVCARPLCLSCAIAFRGRVLGPECLATVLDDAPRQAPPPPPRYPRGDLLALMGFGLALLLTVLPWTRFGGQSGPFDAWRIHWSLLAAVSSALGLAFTIRALVRPVIAGLGAVLGELRPPPLSEPTLAASFAVLGAGLALAGAGVKTFAIVRARTRIR
jgi:hypothetical protein